MVTISELDILKLQFGQNIFLVEKQITKELFVMKMINIGQEGTKLRKKSEKEITAEISLLFSVIW
jgi:hypothetical protein